MTAEQRLAALERRCRLLTIALAAVVLLPAVFMLTGAAQTVIDNFLRVGRLEVVAPNGQLRVQVGQVNDEFGVFVLDAQGQVRASLAEAPDAASISLSKPGGSIRLLANRQGAELVLRDGRDAIRAAANATVAGGQLIINANGGQVITVPPIDN